MYRKSFIFAILGLFFLLWPFGCIVVALALLANNKKDTSVSIYFSLLLSLFLGLLAYTQKSLGYEDTDSVRYYISLFQFETIPLSEVFKNIEIIGMINFVFYPVSSFLVSLTGEVQVVSLFWTCISYFVFYYCIYRLLKFYDCYTNTAFLYVILICTFCFMVFVQISELLKNASAFSVFFLALTIHIEKGWNKWVFVLILLSVGLHPSVFMLFLLLAYKHTNTRFLIISSICLFPIAISINIFEFLWRILPGGDYFSLLSERFDGDFEGSGSIHYVLKELLMLSFAIWIWMKNDKRNNYLCNIVLLYFIISSFNYINLVSYLRFSLFSHYLFAIMLIEYVRFYGRHLDTAVKVIILSMFLLTVRYTIGRTSPGGYSSSYMDNSLGKIVFSTFNDYISVDYE